MCWLIRDDWSRSKAIERTFEEIILNYYSNQSTGIENEFMLCLCESDQCKHKMNVLLSLLKIPTRWYIDDT